MIWLLDDRHLSTLLQTGRRALRIRPRDDVFTTGYWYVRLCQAAQSASGRSGVLSGPLARLPVAEQRAVLATLLELPDEVGLLSLRQLAPVIGRLRRDHELNVLGSEALAAAMELDAHVLLSVRSPMLEAALDAESVRFSVRSVA